MISTYSCRMMIGPILRRRVESKMVSLGWSHQRILGLYQQRMIASSITFPSRLDIHVDSSSPCFHHRSMGYIQEEKYVERDMDMRTSMSSATSTMSSWLDQVSQAILLIKRTFQPSLLRKKRKAGYLKRRQTKDGRKILQRRKAKGRKRLFGA